MVNFYKLSLSQKLSTGNNLPCSEQKGDYYMKLVFLDEKTKLWCTGPAYIAELYMEELKKS